MGGLEERFELGKLIGAGGIGIVHEATDRVLERKVAIKILNKESAGDEERVQRFVREMKVAAKLVSPHAVKVLGAERIRWIHPDCGFWMLSRSVADRKMAALVAGRDKFLGR